MSPFLFTSTFFIVLIADLDWQSMDLNAEKLCFPSNKEEAFIISFSFNFMGILQDLFLNNGEGILEFKIVYL